MNQAAQTKTTPSKAELAIITIIDMAVANISADADNPDTPPPPWQKVIPMLKAAPALKADVESGVRAAQAVVDNWESGNLAGAVRSLNTWINSAKTTLAEAA